MIKHFVFGLLLIVGLGLYQQFYKQYRYNQPKKLIKVVTNKKKEKDVTKVYKKKKAKNEFRILFIGSSQTWGAGASSEENTFVKQFLIRTIWVTLNLFGIFVDLMHIKLQSTM